jgi:hypothetical protein
MSSADGELKKSSPKGRAAKSAKRVLSRAERQVDRALNADPLHSLQAPSPSTLCAPTTRHSTFWQSKPTRCHHSNRTPLDSSSQAPHADLTPAVLPSFQVPASSRPHHLPTLQVRILPNDNNDVLRPHTCTCMSSQTLKREVALNGGESYSGAAGFAPRRSWKFGARQLTSICSRGWPGARGGGQASRCCSKGCVQAFSTSTSLFCLKFQEVPGRDGQRAGRGSFW